MFLSSERAARSQAFERLVTDTVRVLADPRVRRALGDTALQLKVMAEEAVLPNLHHGTLSFPREHAASDAYSLTPLSDAEDGVFTLDESMLRPTPHRIALIESQVRAGGKSRYDANKFVADTAWKLARKSICTPGFKPTTLSQHSVYQDDHPATGALYTSRPLIRSRVSHSDSVLGIGSRMAHELIHARQSEELMTAPTDSRAYLIAIELEAYKVEHDIIMALGADPLYNTDMGLSRTSLTVEEQRQRYTLPDDPYRVTPELDMLFSTHDNLLDLRSTM